jgi:hypothetical protein
MDRLKQIKELKDRVHSLLKKDMKYRDNDVFLIARIWNDELTEMKFDVNKLSAFEFLKLYAAEKLTLSDSITRQRRKLQEDNPSLRGTKWRERQAHANEVAGGSQGM